MKKNQAPVASLAHLSEVTPVISSHLMQAAPEHMSVTEQVQAYAILKKIGGAVESRLKELRDPLMGLAEAKGTVDKASGTKEYDVDGSLVTVQHRKPSIPAKDPLKALLLTHKLDIMDCFDEVKTLEVNASKLNFLVETGKLTKEEVQALLDADDKPALVVVPSPMIKEALSVLSLKKAGKALTE